MEFNLKPNNYMIHDLDWLIEKFKETLGLSEHKFLSLGGRLVIAPRGAF